jgi:outer membrane receptor protein involved in Fe transport
MMSFFDFGISLNAGATIDPDGPGPTPALPVVQFGNPYSDPLIITSYEIAWDKNIRAIDGEFKANVFAMKVENATGANNVICNPGDAACGGALQFAIQGGNVGDSKSWGVELGLNGKIGSNWRWDINNTVQKIYDDYSVSDSSTEDTTPLNITNAHLGYQNNKWEADLFVYYTSAFKQEEPTANIAVTSPLVRVPGHVGVSARLGYKIDRKTTIDISGQELQASHSTTSRSIDTERRVFVSLDRTF